jgi:hypothetical protein
MKRSVDEKLGVSLSGPLRVAALAGAIVAALVAAIALASPPVTHLTQEICIHAADAGLVCRQSDGGVDFLSRGCEIQNQGSTTLWCALQNPQDAQPFHSRSVPAGSTWALDVVGQVAVWCIPGGGIDQQSNLDGGVNGGLDGGPAGCTIVNVAH